MKLYRAAEMREADRAAAAAGVSSLLLMEAAGRAVADAVLRNFPEIFRVLVLCGKGNNGGDGYVAARHLHMMGREVSVLDLATGSDSGDSASEDVTTVRSACLAHLTVNRLTPETLATALRNDVLVIDALLGSGLKRPLEGELAQMIGALNESGLPVLSVDVPTGIGADAAVPTGPHVRAALTVQLAGPKLASALLPARSAFGEQEIVPIGIPTAILEQASRIRLLEGSATGIPRRNDDSHKYSVGTVLVLAGSPRYLGAAELACRGAYRAGAGLVTLAAEERLPGGWPEVVFSRLDWNSDPAASLAGVDERRAQAVVAGPGLDEHGSEQLPDLVAARKVPWVLDAGALRRSPTLREAVREHGRCVLTPHHGEAARLLECSGQEVHADPVGTAARIAGEWHAVCVLKGASTVIALPDGTASVSPDSHPGMATGGTGDVLAGVLGAFLAAGGDLLERVEAAVTVHALAGKLAGAELGAGLVASDVVEHLPLALQELTTDPS